MRALDPVAGADATTGRGAPGPGTPSAASAASPCPLCGASDPAAVEGVRTAVLADLYARFVGEAVREEFARSPEVLTLRRCGRCGLEFFEPELVGSGALYALLQRFPWYYEVEKPEYAVAASHLAPGCRLLDVGCGAGHFSAHAPGRAYVGLELNAAARAQANARGLDVRGDALADHSAAHAGRYDAVVAFQVLEHVPDPGRFLALAASCLRPGGTLVVSVPSLDTYLRGAGNYLLNLPPHHQTRWPDESLRHVAALVGGELVTLVHEPLRPIHVDDYRRVTLEKALAALAGRRARLVDVSGAARLRSLAANLLARVQPWPRPRADTPGHTVTAVYRVGGSR